MGWADTLEDAVNDALSGDGGGGSGNSGSSGGNLEIPGWLTKYAGVFKAFGKNPAGFVIGAVMSGILGGIETVVETLIDSILFIALGSDKTISATGTLGIADIPVFAVSLLGGSTGTVVGAFTTAVRAFNRAAVGVSTAAGPLSPILYAAILAVTMIVVAWALRTGIAVIADAIPGVQGLI